MGAVAHIDQYKTGRFFSDEFRGGLSWNGWETNVLLRNEGVDPNGLPRLSRVARGLGMVEGKDARGVAVLDFDHDGALDLAVAVNPGDTGDPARSLASLWRNDLGGDRSWLVVETEGTESNRDGVGAVVTVRAGERSWRRRVEAGSGYAAQSTRRLHFGLGDVEEVEAIAVRWPSGEVTTSGPVPAGRRVLAVEDGRFDVGELPPSAPASPPAADAVEVPAARASSAGPSP